MAECPWPRQHGWNILALRRRLFFFPQPPRRCDTPAGFLTRVRDQNHINGPIADAR